MKTSVYYKGYSDYQKGIHLGTYHREFYLAISEEEKQRYLAGWKRGFDEQAERLAKQNGWNVKLG